jgi:predicted RNA methylase
MKVENDVLIVLSHAAISENALRLNGQLERKLYERTNQVLAAAGGVWNRKAKAHMFEESPAELIEAIILTGEVTSPREFGFFPTPPPLVTRLLELAEIEPWMLVLEPSAGRGALAQPIAQIATVECFELLPANVAVLKAGGYARAIFPIDFLSAAPCVRYDRVVMNPPFARQDDIRHVNHALQFLKPEGRLVSIMAAGVLFRENSLTLAFRRLLRERGGFMEVNPDESFRTSGTLIRTVTVVMPGSA